MERQELLEMRLDALAQDIAKVRTVVDAAKRRGDQLAEVRRIIGRGGPVRQPLFAVKSTLQTLKDILEENREVVQQLRQLNQDVVPQILRSVDGLEGIRKGLTDANDTLDEISRTFVDLDQWGSGLQKSLDDRCTEAENKLGEVRGHLGLKPLREVWGGYEALVDGKCHPLFTEYVDFLGGLTLRDTALDDGVCSMTDRLLELYVGLVSQRALAVPSHPGSIGDAMRSLVKLGFPEWTVWSVPLVGMDIGLGIAEAGENQIGLGISDGNATQQLLHRFVGGNRSAELLRRLLAEAFAVYTLGLAYGCAAIILRFQPHHDDGNPQTPSDVERAQLVLEMLQRLASNPGDPLAVSASRLGQHWHEAVEQLTSPEGRDLGWISDFADAAWLELGRLRVEPYDGPRFAAGKTRWQARLAAEVVDTDEVAAASSPLLAAASPPIVGDHGTVLELLNTAWALRLEEPGVAERVTANVNQIWRSSERPPATGLPLGDLTDPVLTHPGRRAHGLL